MSRMTPYPDEPRCSAVLANHQCQLYDHHPGMHRHVDKRIDLDATWESPPWRFDVPEVPAHVTALRDCDGTMWVRDEAEPGNWYMRYGLPIGRPYHEVLRYAPLVECEDPRAAS